MDRQKLLIAEGTEDFRIALADALRGAYRVMVCSDGTQTREQMRLFRPDILVLDMMLPGLDGISLLQWAVQQQICPMVLATTRFVNDYVLESLSRLGVGYVMVKPCELGATVARIGDLSQRIRQPVLALPDQRTRVSNLLLALGVPTKLRGYAYLREAILFDMEMPGQSITKVIYPEVARLCGCEAMHVERSIRSAIQAAWAHREEHLWQLYFPQESANGSRWPTNGAFLTRLADGLRNRQVLDELPDSSTINHEGVSQQ